MMKKICLIISILGLFFLLLISSLSAPIKITSESNLSEFPPNQQFLVQGKVIEETLTKNNKILQLDNNFQLQCPKDCPQFLNKNISAIVKSEFYNEKYYLKVLKLSYNK